MRHQNFFLMSHLDIKEIDDYPLITKHILSSNAVTE